VDGLIAGFGFLAGFIDAIVGGGGLITLPVLLSALGTGAEAVGTNKIVGVSAALAALWVYSRAGHFRLVSSLRFSFAVGVGSFAGSLATPLFPEWAFGWFVILISPIILWLVYEQRFWVPSPSRKPASTRVVILMGILAGFYDGMWGPGGGTFLFLALYLGARQPLLEALAASKFANACSAGTALFSFALRGYVHWQVGLLMATSVVLGALIGARLNTRGAAKLVRPMLVVVVCLLAVKAFYRLG
jgi:uncharacterized protein